MAGETKKWYENAPLWGGIEAIGQGLMGQEGDKQRSNLHLVNPMQMGLYNTMYKKLMGGGGDFGFGSAYKQGKNQVQQMMAQRGISPQSGVNLAAMGNMTANAVGQDAQNRRNTWFQLMGQPLQTATVSGANFVPGSTSRGIATNQQANFFNNDPRRTSTYDWS